MTNLEALRAKVVYPLEDNSLILALIDRGLTDSATYVTSNRKPLELAQADCFMIILGSPNIGEEGFTLSHSNKAELRKTASAIYKKWGEADPFEAKIKDITEYW